MTLLLLALACRPTVQGGHLPSDTETETDDGSTVPGDPTHPWQDHHLYDVEITLDPDDWDTLRHQARNIVELLTGDCQAEPFASPYTWFIGDVLIDGQSFEDVEIRKKGLVGSSSTTKPGLRLDFDDHVEDQHFLGAEHLTLNNGVQDPSLVHQCLAYGLFEAAGYPASRCAFATVRVNGADLGVYVTVEPVRAALLADRFGDGDGALFEGTLSDFRDGWTGTFDPDTDAAEDDRSAIDGLVAALESDDPVDALEPVLDVDAFQTYRALEALVGQWDGYTGNTNNFYIYQRPSDGRVIFLPWGLDAAFGQVDWFDDGQAHVYRRSALPIALHQDADTREAYEARLVELLDDAWDEAQLEAKVDAWQELLEDHVLDQDQWEEGLDGVRDFIEVQPGVLLAELEDGGAPPYGTTLRDDPCLVERGTVSGSFQTVFGSSDLDDWWSQGSGELDLSWDGQPIPFSTVAAVSGQSEGDDALLAVLGAVDHGTLLMPYFVLPRTSLDEGGSLDIDWNEVVGYLGYATTGVEFTTAAYLWGGQLQLDQSGTLPGAAVSGTFSTTLWGGSE